MCSSKHFFSFNPITNPEVYSFAGANGFHFCIQNGKSGLDKPIFKKPWRSQQLTVCLTRHQRTYTKDPCHAETRREEWILEAVGTSGAEMEQDTAWRSNPTYMGRGGANIGHKYHLWFPNCFPSPMRTSDLFSVLKQNQRHTDFPHLQRAQFWIIYPLPQNISKTYK